MTVPSGQPSPRPWKLTRGIGGRETVISADIEDGYCHEIAFVVRRDGRTMEEAEANCELIVEAVNGWDALRGERDRLRAALEPFAAKEECDIGFLVGEDEEHTRNCAECQRILVARAALGSGRPSAPEEET